MDIEWQAFLIDKRWSENDSKLQKKKNVAKKSIKVAKIIVTTK